MIDGDSLLSNISNITVKIDHNKSDGSGFFKNFSHQNQHEKQIPIDDLEDQQSFNHGSLLERIILKCKEEANGQQNGNTWVTGVAPQGVSEQQDQSSESQKNSQNQILDQCSQIEKENSNQAIINETGQINRQKQLMQQQLMQKQLMQKQLMQKQLMQKRLKNQTKNIPKNYGKAIITFIQKYSDKVKYITQKYGVVYEDFLQQLKERKKTINTIADLRNMWIDYKYANCMRLLSNLFLRKYALHYIFNSRICNFASHIKYRYRLCEAIKEPYTFKHIKDY